jgi:threonine aldolase
MLYFINDYMEGAHPLILDALQKTNMEKTAGYGSDVYTERAQQKIRTACQCPNADIHFLSGGTQTNAIVIKTLLRTYEGVIAPDSGHISTHEAGAIECGGHKILTLANKKGKISAEQVETLMADYYNDENNAHVVKPGMVYISYPTEYGTLYTKQELESLSNVCKKHDLYFYLDGARLGYGLGVKDHDVSLETIAKVCDAFYIGGTKVGAMFGEAVVIPQKNLIPQFMTIIKQNGALLAKGRLLGIQFDVLFTNDLYAKIGAHGVEMATKLKNGLVAKGYQFYQASETNQLFPIINNDELKKIAEHIAFSFWEKYDETSTVIRLATSWATRAEDVDALLKIV